MALDTSGEKPLYCRHSPSERTELGVDRERGDEICLGCKLPYLPGSPNSRLRLGDPLGTLPPPEARRVTPSRPVDGRPIYKSRTETTTGRGGFDNRIHDKGFFTSLFDFGFTSFITLRFLSVIYGVAVFLILMSSLVVFFGILSQGGMYAVLATLVPIVALFYVILLRVSLEMIALFFRIGENTSLMAAAAGVASSHEAVGSTSV